jgi:hypothetical protein
MSDDLDEALDALAAALQPHRANINDLRVTPLERECTVALMSHVALHVIDRRRVLSLASALEGSNVSEALLDEARAEELLERLRLESNSRDVVLEPGRVIPAEFRDLLWSLVRGWRPRCGVNRDKRRLLEDQFTRRL